jgi:hypothetical protein
MKIPLAPAFFLSALCLTAHAADLTVGPASSGATFQTIQAAVDAAAPGDRIFVAAGLYNEQLLIQKGVELIGAGSGSTTVRTNFGFPFLPAKPALWVRQLPADQRLRVCDLGFTGAAGGTTVSAWSPVVRLEQNLGRLELSALRIDLGNLPPSPANQPAGVLEIFDCNQVIADQIRVLANPELYTASATANLLNGLAGARILRSNVWISSSEFQGQGGRALFPFQSAVNGNGGAGLASVDSELDLARTIARGGKGASLPPVQLPAFGGAGLDASGSTLRIAGGTDNQFLGAPAVDLSAQGSLVGAAGAGLRLANLSSAELASDVLTQGGAGAPTVSAGPNIAVDPSSSFVTLGRRLPSLAFVPTSPLLGQLVAVQYEGEPASVHLRALWISSGPALPIPGIGGTLLLDLATLLIVETTLLDANGQSTTQTTLSSNPGLQGLGVVEQNLQATATHLDLGPPAIVNLR